MSFSEYWALSFGERAYLIEDDQFGERNSEPRLNEAIVKAVYKRGEI